MTFNVAVTGCYWNEEKGQWRVALREERPGQEPRDFEDHCDLLLNGTGILNNYKVRASDRIGSVHRSLIKDLVAYDSWPSGQVQGQDSAYREVAQRLPKRAVG